MRPMHPEATGSPAVVRWVVPGYPLVALAERIATDPSLRALLDDGTLAGLDVAAEGVDVRLGAGRSWRREGEPVRTALAAALEAAAPSAGCSSQACAPAGCTGCPVSRR